MSNINSKRTEIYSLDQQIKALHREKDVLASDSEDRVKLELKKEELENHKKKHKKMLVQYILLQLQPVINIIYLIPAINLGYLISVC